MTVATQVVQNGPRNLCLNLDITGSSDESDTVVVDVSAYDIGDVKILSVQSSLTGFNADLDWDATSNTPAIHLVEGAVYLDWVHVGGLLNNSGAGKTGDLLLTTSGLGAGDHGTIFLEMRKRGNAV